MKLKLYIKIINTENLVRAQKWFIWKFSSFVELNALVFKNPEGLVPPQAPMCASVYARRPPQCASSCEDWPQSRSYSSVEPAYVRLAFIAPVVIVYLCIYLHFSVTKSAKRNCHGEDVDRVNPKNTLCLKDMKVVNEVTIK